MKKIFFLVLLSYNVVDAQTIRQEQIRHLEDSLAVKLYIADSVVYYTTRFRTDSIVSTRVRYVDSLVIYVTPRELKDSLANYQPRSTYLIPSDSISIRNYSNVSYLKNADSISIRNYSNSLYLHYADSVSIRNYSNQLYQKAIIIGRGSLNSGIDTIFTAAIDSISQIFLTRTSLAGVIGELYVSSVSAGNWFIIKSSDIGDTSDFNYMIVKQ